MTQLLEDLARGAHTHVLLQARDLVLRPGALEDLSLELVTPDTLCVRGSVNPPHGVRHTASIEWHPNGRQRFQHGLCLCQGMPGRLCLHQSALLLAVSEWVDYSIAKGITGVDEWAVAHWLKQVAEAAAPEVSAADASRQLLYVIAPEGGRMMVEAYTGRPRKQGGFGHVQRLGSFAVAPWVEGLDRRILALLETVRREHHPEPSASLELRGEAGGDVLMLLLRTGRLFWRSPDQALQEATARTGQLVWQADEQGAHPRLEDEQGPLRLLPTEPPYYIDEQAGLIGPLVLHEAVPVVERLLAAPHFSPIAQRARVADFAKLAAKGVLPLPPAVHTKQLQGAHPRPVMRLDSRQMLVWGRRGQERRTVHAASLFFEYANERVPALPAAASVVRVVDGEVLQLARDTEAEKTYLALLHDFVPLAAQRVVQTPQPGPHVVTLEDSDRWLDAVADRLPALEEQGWRLEYAATFQLRPLEVEGWYGEAEEGAGDWFELNLGILHEGRRIDLLPLLVSTLRRLPSLDQRTLLGLPDDATLPVMAAGGVFQLPLARLRPILQTLVELFDTDSDPLERSGHLRLSRLDAARLGDIDLPWVGGERLLALGRQLRDFSGVHPVEPPAGLHAELRGYQREGLNWLNFLREYGFSGVLADDMGLGKTVQTLALLALEQARDPGRGPSLLVAPTSLVHNWRREAARFAPGLKVVVLHGLERGSLWREAEGADLVITSYSLLPRDAQRLSARQWHYLVFDEAQYLKNPRAKATEVARQLPARHRLALTGTPMENHLGELWSIFDVIMPNFLGTEARFRRLYRYPVERQGDQERRQQLARRVAPFLLRRTKEQVAAELPPKTEIVRAVALEGAQRDLYEAIRLAMDAKVRAEVADKGLARSQIVVLEALLKLRQVCCDPRLVNLQQAGRVRQSAKLDLLMDLLPELLDEGRKVLLFSQFTSMLALIRQALDAQGIPYVVLTGDTVDRVTPIDRFQSGEVPLFLISLKAGGVGLNLTAADTVIHYDPWWNPAVERQATDRAHRIGQDKPVFVYKLITEGTVEEKILELQGRKAALAEGIYGDNSEVSSSLNATDLEELLRPLGRES